MVMIHEIINKNLKELNKILDDNNLELCDEKNSAIQWEFTIATNQEGDVFLVNDGELGGKITNHDASKMRIYCKKKSKKHELYIG